MLPVVLVDVSVVCRVRGLMLLLLHKLLSC